MRDPVTGNEVYLVKPTPPVLPGDMEPTAFLCKGCARRVQEATYGAGFERCGAVMADKKYMLCPRCLSIVMELLEALEHPHKLEPFIVDLRVNKIVGVR